MKRIWFVLLLCLLFQYRPLLALDITLCSQDQNTNAFIHQYAKDLATLDSDSFSPPKAQTKVGAISSTFLDGPEIDPNRRVFVKLSLNPPDPRKDLPSVPPVVSSANGLVHKIPGTSPPPVIGSQKQYKWIANEYHFKSLDKSPAVLFTSEIKDDVVVADLAKAPMSFDDAARADFYIQQITPMAKAQGLDLDLVPVMVEVKEETSTAQTIMKGDEGKVKRTVQVGGGQRDLFFSRTTGKYYKRFKKLDHYTPFKIAREKLVTAYTNFAFKDAVKKFGIGLEVEPHDYTLAAYGWEGQTPVIGKSVDEYRKSLAPAERVVFEKHLNDLKKELVVQNKIVGRMVEEKMGGIHFYKGVSAEEIQKVTLQAEHEMKAINPNATPEMIKERYIDIMAERGYLADIDTGELRGTKHDFDN